ncbi:hypothetical protein [Sphingomonas natans]|uniref:hypothetical protein n=1 Tax=Sphingomonas natans TaxID=3063330 RepID=UPI0026E37F83|nr:hypothetical protein [Sphingomonas sp. BIUV-7]
MGKHCRGPVQIQLGDLKSKRSSLHHALTATQAVSHLWTIPEEHLQDAIFEVMFWNMAQARGFTDDEIREIRSLCAACHHCGHRPPLGALSRHVGISTTALLMIRAGLTYKHVPCQPPLLAPWRPSKAERAGAIKALARAEIPWATDDDLRLAAEVFALANRMRNCAQPGSEPIDEVGR